MWAPCGSNSTNRSHAAGSSSTPNWADFGCSPRGTPCVLTKPLWLSRSTPSQPRSWLICARTGPKAGNSTCGGNGAPIWGPRNKANQSKCAHVGRVRPRTSPLPLSPPSVAAVAVASPGRGPPAPHKRSGALYCNHACPCEAQLVDVAKGLKPYSLFLKINKYSLRWKAKGGGNTCRRNCASKFALPIVVVGGVVCI